MALPDDRPAPPMSPTFASIARIHDDHIAKDLTRDELLRRLRSLYGDIGAIDRAIEAKLAAIRATIAAINANHEPATDAELGFVRSARYDKPRIL